MIKMKGGFGTKDGWPEGWKHESVYTTLDSISAGNAIEIRAGISNPAKSTMIINEYPNGFVSDFSFSKDSMFLAVSLSYPVGNAIWIYKKSGNILTKFLTFGSGSAYACSFSFDDSFLAVTHDSTPFISIYKREGDNFTKLPNPSSLPTGACVACSFSPDGTYLAVANSATSPYITIYKRNGDDFTKLQDPLVLPSGPAYDCSFSLDGMYLAVSHAYGPLKIYLRNGDVFTSQTISLLPSGLGYGCTFTPDGLLIAVGENFASVLKKSGSVFSKISDITIPTGTVVRGCSVSFDSSHLAITYEASPYFGIHKRDGDAFTQISTPVTGLTSYSRGCEFSLDCSYLAVGSRSGKFIVYENEMNARALNLSVNSYSLPNVVGFGVAQNSVIMGEDVNVNMLDPLTQALAGGS